MKRLAVALLCVLTLSGCARNVPLPTWMASPEGTCHLPVVKLTANQFDDPDEAAVSDGRMTRTRRFIGTLGDGFKSSTPGKRLVDGKAVLVLSGGSLHGAFGAGLFYGWKNSHVANDEIVPTYDIVTGVSTGALQSTFIFLASSAEPNVQAGARDLAARLDRKSFLWPRLQKEKNGVQGPDTSYLATLAQDYMPDREGDLLQLHPLQRLSPNKAGFIELFNNNSLATMAPLRSLINAELTDRAIAGVAHEGQQGRRLYVAMADLANGYGYAADLTKLAELAVLAAYPDHQSPADLQDLKRVFPNYDPHMSRSYISEARNCYTDALLASSSVPPGVEAVPIEIIKEGKDRHILDPDYKPHADVPSNRVAARHVFVDGGAAFAVFFSQLRDEVTDLPKVDMDLIVNGSYYPQEWDKWVDDKGKTKPIESVRLSSLDYGLQAAEILQGQVRLFSVQEARRWELGRGRFRWAFIDNDQIDSGADGLDNLTPWHGKYKGSPDQWSFATDTGKDSCKNWHAADAKNSHPMEFYPIYMQCLLNYGMSRGEDPGHRWNMCYPADSPRCPGHLPVRSDAVVARDEQTQEMP
jgi:predicted acylesterase/phospholipase RssA